MDHAPVPNQAVMNEAYERLIRSRQKQELLTVECWIRLAHLARFDVRAAELWVAAFANSWTEIAPVILSECNLQSKTPSVLGVLLEQVEIYLEHTEAKKRFRLWKAIVMHGVNPANGEQFFVGIRGFATEGVRQDAEKTLSSYRRWGYVGSEVLLNKFSQRQRVRPRTYLDAKTRRSLLSELLKRKPQITVEDYVEACGGAISPRSAQLDLQKEKKLKASGMTQARVYRLL